MKNGDRKYVLVSQYFHNYEHDPEGRNHCIGAESNPYVIIHKDGKHIINTEYARGHGRGGHPQWFKFMEKHGDGYDLSSGVKVDVGDVTEKGRKPKSTAQEEFDLAFEEAMRRKKHI
ncbi:MAG: hypothetical protein WC294_00155 [Methanoregula sp.]|jgi:hypothetical protein